MTTIPAANWLTSRRGNRFADRAFVVVTRVAAFAVVAILLLLALRLLTSSMLAWQTFGVVDFVTGTTWDPVAGIYSALPYIVGTTLVPARAPDRRADRVADGGLPGRAGSAAIGHAADLHDRAPRRDPERRVRIVGRFRPRAVPARHGGNPGSSRRSAGSRSSAGRRSGSAVHRGVILAIMILPTIVSISREVIRSVPDIAARGDGRPRGDAMGDGDTRRRALRALGHRRGRDPRPRARSRRDDGRDDDHRERPEDPHATVRSGTDHRLEDRHDVQ